MTDLDQKKVLDNESSASYRKTTQYLMPGRHEPPLPGKYDIYPAFDIGAGKIDVGYEHLANIISTHQTIIIDGFVGILWEDFRDRLDKALRRKGVAPNWTYAGEAFRSEADVDRLVQPYLGGDDPIFGSKYQSQLRDFFDMEELLRLTADPDTIPNIIYGCGAFLAGVDGFRVYIDIPKNEIQFRSRAGVVQNLGKREIEPPKVQYKRFYFVDWVVLSEHKRQNLPNIDLFIDLQRQEEPTMTSGEVLREALSEMSRTFFRVRPWFEPGPWGGQWIRDRIEGLSPDVPNYAWSFELIVPENGIVLKSDGRMLECSFDSIMFQEHQNVLGDHADTFSYEFPIRFDFLDTIRGGNLSLQCHPRPEFIRKHFGETFTQDETYYILDCDESAEVYLGFNDDVDPEAFRIELERSFREGTPVDVEKHVNKEKAKKHDLFLIPNGTVHCSGEGNLVLEISATPYIFTFKMYDWMRLDLDGKPRPLNIARAFENLYFERKGERVKEELVSTPRLVERGNGWQLYHLPTHRDHFYDVERVEFKVPVELRTKGSPQVMNLVEGNAIVLESNGRSQRFNYAETFVVPAEAKSFRLIPEDGGSARVVKAFLKEGRAI